MQKLRVLRAQAGLTLRELEERSGISKDAISEIERGLRNPRTSTLVKLADGLGVDHSELIGTRIGAVTVGPDGSTILEEPMRGPFTAVYQQDEGWWVGYVEELPGANAQERTLEEARESLREAVADVLEANRELTRTEFGGGDVVREPIGA